MPPDLGLAFVLDFLVGLGSGILLGSYLTFKLVSWNTLPMQGDVEEDGQSAPGPYAYLEGSQPVRAAERPNWTQMDEAAFRRRYPKTHE